MNDKIVLLKEVTRTMRLLFLIFSIICLKFTNGEPFTLGNWLEYCIKKMNTNIDELFEAFTNHEFNKLGCVLECALKKGRMLKSDGDFDLQVCKEYLNYELRNCQNNGRCGMYGRLRIIMDCYMKVVDFNPDNCGKTASLYRCMMGF